MGETIFDLADMDTVSGANSGADIELFHPANKKPLGIFFNINGADSEKFTKAERKKRDKRLKLRDIGALSLSAEELDTETIEMLAENTNGWTGLVQNGETVVFSKKMAVEIYTDYPWIKDQINVAIVDRSNFLK